MDANRRGRGSYNRSRGGRGRGRGKGHVYRGQVRGCAWRDSERDNEEIRGDYQETITIYSENYRDQVNRGGYFPQRDGRGGNRGGPNCRERGKQNANTNFQRGPREIGPDEIEVFKFIVKEMNGEGTLDDIQLESSFFKDYRGDVDEWFKRHSRKFAIFKKWNSIVKVCVYVKCAEYCLDYITRRGCAKDGCHRYHICKHLLCGLCSFGKNCKFSHDSLDMHNGPISNQLGFNNVFNNEQIIQILSLRFPHVCECWNTEGSCPDTTCCKLHICQRHVFGDCLEGEGCPFEHSLTTPHNHMVTDAYHMTKWNPKIFNKIIFVLKRPPAHVERNAADLSAPDETNEPMEIGTGIDESNSPRPTPWKIHTGPERETYRSDNAGKFCFFCCCFFVFHQTSDWR